MNKWPKAIHVWQERDVGCMSIPFTWLLPAARRTLKQLDMFAKRWLVGGPAVQLMPGFLDNIPNATIGKDCPGILQRINPLATRTTLGCPNRCKFCGIGQRLIEGDFQELPEWPDLPVICDNNLLAASDRHVESVVAKLARWGWCDFNQGLDATRLTTHHAELIATIKKPMVRLALDSDAHRKHWLDALDRLRTAGIPKSRIRSYVLCGFHSTPTDDWRRCNFVETQGVLPLPMWFHPLNALHYNAVTQKQRQMGWTEEKQRQLMGWFYKRRGTPLVNSHRSK